MIGIQISITFLFTIMFTAILETAFKPSILWVFGTLLELHWPEDGDY